MTNGKENQLDLNQVPTSKFILVRKLQFHAIEGTLLT